MHRQTKAYIVIRLSLTPVALGKPIPTDLVLALVMKAWITDIFLEYAMFYFVFVHLAARLLISNGLSNNFRATGRNRSPEKKSFFTYVL